MTRANCKIVKLQNVCLFDACEWFKKLLRQYPYHSTLVCLQLKTFYNGLMPSSRNMLDVSTGEVLLSKSYTYGFELMKSITSNTYQWPTTRVAPAIANKKPIGMHEFSESTVFAAQVAQIHNIMKALMTPLDVPVVKPVNVVKDTTKVICTYYGGANLFDNHSSNPMFVNFLGNNNNTTSHITTFSNYYVLAKDLIR